MMSSELTFIAGPVRDNHVVLCVGCHTKTHVECQNLARPLKVMMLAYSV